MRYTKPGHCIETDAVEPGVKLSVNWGNSGRCFSCGNKATAVWRGVEATVEVCPTCAVETLPALIADACHAHPGRGVADFTVALNTITRVFWRAVACRLANALRPRRDGLRGVWSEPIKPR